MISNYKMARISGCCLFLSLSLSLSLMGASVCVSSFLWRICFIIVCVCSKSYSPKISQQTVPSYSYSPFSCFSFFIAIAYAFQVFFSHCTRVCVCVCLAFATPPWGVTPASQDMRTRDPMRLHDIIRSCALYLSIQQIQKERKNRLSQSPIQFFAVFVVVFCACAAPQQLLYFYL